MEIKNFSFIKDEPILPGNPGYFDFYHKSFSPALKDMMLSDSCPHTIGLFSKWGTGKSSIIDQLRDDLKDETNTHVIVFDAWKYQEDSLRRTFLIYLEKFLKEKGCKVPEDLLSGFYKKRTSSVTTNEDIKENKKVSPKGWLRKIWAFLKEYKAVFFFLILPLIVVGIFTVLLKYYPDNKWLSALNTFFTYVNTLSWFIFLLKPVAEKALEKVTNKVFESTKTYTEIRTQMEEEDRLNTPEQFEYVFNELVNCVAEGKLVIVFDNIDRVQGDVALKILSTIKTFLDVGKSKVIFLVPCDANAINKQIRAFYNNQKDTDFDESEYLKKLFNVVINTPEFIDDDLYGYTVALINQTGDIKDLISKEDVISVVTKAFKNNPREVKQFINNLISAVLVASKSEVADHVLSEENIAYFTKVAILKQKFPEAYKRLRDNWNEPEKIIEIEGDEKELRDFLVLTSTTTTDDAEPFIYFKRPQLESGLKEPQAIRKALIDGNTDQFEKLASSETNKSVLIQYVARLLRNYKSQTRILPSIFSSQIQGFLNIKQDANASVYLDASVEAIEAIWNNYLQLPIVAIFDLLTKITAEAKRSSILDRYISVLSSEEIKLETNTPFLLLLIDQLLTHYNLLSDDQKQKIKEAIRQNLFGRNDVLLKFDSIKMQNVFVDNEVLRKIFQETLTNKNLKENEFLFETYKEFIIASKSEPLLLTRIPEFITAQNSETPATNEIKINFFDSLLTVLSTFGASLKILPANVQMEIFRNLSTSYNQSTQTDILQPKVVNALRWLEIYSNDASTKAEAHSLVNNFISQSSRDTLGQVFEHRGEKGKQNLITAYLATIKTRSLQEIGVFEICYQYATDEQKSDLLKYFIENKPDHGTGFLEKFGEKIPDRAKIIDILLEKVQKLSIQDRVNILTFLKGKIAQNDSVDLKQKAIKQIMEYLKSKDQAMIQFGATFLREKFLSESDEREVAKDMIDFYNNLTVLQPYDLPVIEHLASIETKLQDALKGKLVYLILSNISSDREHSIQKPLISYVQKMKVNSELYEKDYSDLMERLLTWTESPQKDIVTKDIIEMLKFIPGAKAKEYLKKINHLIKVEPSK
jgi:hypothetical protein